MKVLLLIPSTCLIKSYGKLRSFSNPQPSIGIAYIASVLRRDGHKVKIVDAYFNQYGNEQLIQLIRDYDPNVVGMSVLTPSSENIYNLSKMIRHELPDIKIVMGNIHANLFAAEILSMNYADFVVHGEGELAMSELVTALQSGAETDDVMGISFTRNGKIINTPRRNHLEDLDSLPYPAWDLLTDKYSTDPRTAVKHGSVERQILATRGCPNECTFCSSRMERSLGSKYRMRSPEKIVDEMVYMNEMYGSDVFAFVDLAFPLVKKHAVDVCNEIIGRSLQHRFKWVTECRVKPLDTETLMAMKNSGCVRICLGIESGDDDILRRLKKRFTTDDVRSAVKMALKAGLEVDGMFMIGLPGETEKQILQTINFAVELNLRYAIFNIFVPYPGCELFDVLSAENKIHFDSWSEFTSYPTYSGGRPVYVPDGLTHEQMMKLQKYAMRRFYLRPRFILAEMSRFKIAKFRAYYEGVKSFFDFSHPKSKGPQSCSLQR